MASRPSDAGETFLSDVLQSLLDWLYDNCQRYELPKDLTDSLSAVRVFLGDAETKLCTKPWDEQWLVNLQDTVYDVEELVDEMVADDAVTELTPTTCPEGSKPLSNDKRFRSKIKTIVERLQVLEKEAAKLRLLLKLTEGEAFEIFRSVTSSADESIVYGRDKDKDAIAEFLLSDDATGDGVSVLSIIGMAGIGKTALAQLAFNDQKLKNHFDIRVWVHVGDNFSVFKVMDEITWGTPEVIPYRNIKKFLFVLDDVWAVNDNDWNYFRQYLGAAEKGSKIIVTSRSKAVVAQVSAMSVCEPPLLCEEDCWSVFAKYALKNTSPSSDPDFVAVANEISKKCHGLPLAAKALGSVLCSKPSAEEWKAVLTNRLWDVGTETSNVLPVLNVWYSILTANLKRCIAYCSVFPPNYEFEKEKLVRLWMAEGFLHQPKGQREEDAGEDCFAYLLWMSFFRPSSRNKSRFVMHPLFNDLALQKSEKSCYRLTVGDDGPYKIPVTVLHLSHARTEFDASQAFRDLSCTKRLRTFLSLSSRSLYYKYPHDVLEDLLVKQPHLRVLSLPFYFIDEMPKAIGRLKQLRYLDLCYAPVLAQLPSSLLLSLKNLQTLDLSYCFYLRKLPEDICKLINLRHLLITGSGVQEMPLRLYSLSNLQTLSDFIQGYGGSRVNELSGLSNLRGALSISILHNLDPHKDGLDAGLEKMIYLDKLAIKWRWERVNSEKDAQTLENLVPPRELKELFIESYGGRKFPDWLGDFTFCNIVKLRLIESAECSLLPSVGQLPSLEVLIIEKFHGVESVRQEFYGRNSLSNKPFQSLKTLRFEKMKKWQKWETPDAYEEFPCLEELYIKDCPLLVGDMPKRLPSLAKLLIFRCPKLVDSLPLPALPAQCGVWIDSKPVPTRSEDEAFSSGSMDAKRIAEEAAKSYEFDATPISLGSSGHTDIIPLQWSPPLEKSTFLQQETASPSPNPAHDQADEVVSSPRRSEPIAVTQLGMFPGSTEIPSPPQEDDQTELDTTTDEDDDWDRMLHQYSSPGILNVSDIAELDDIAEGKLPTDIHTLRIEGCDILESLSPEILSNNPHLLHLYVIDCGSLTSFPVRADSTALKTLQIRNCRKLEFSPEKMPKLDHLCIGSSCDSLDYLSLGFFPRLRILSLWDCINLKGLKDLKSLESLEIRDCPNLKSILPEGLLGPKLTSIFILNCKNLQSLSSQMCHLRSVNTLFISQCPRLESLPTDGLPANLSSLCIILCNKLTLTKEWKLYKLKALTLFEIEGGCEDIVSFPVEGLLPASLVSLRISRLLNLKYLNKDALEKLTSLEKLEINCCKKLHSLPDGLPSSLSSLYINECPLLKAKLRNKHGLDWSRIADIPSIYIDDEEWH